MSRRKQRGGMGLVIYADVLFAVNLLIDGLLLSLALRLAHQPPAKKGRLFLAACVGGAAALVLLLPSLPVFILLPLRIAVALLMVLVACGRQPLSSFLLTVFWYYGLGVLLGGLAALTDGLFSPAGFYYHNQAFYINLSFLQLLLLTSGVYLFLRGFCFFRQQNDRARQKGRLFLSLQGREQTLSALVDSGNLLCDPLTGRPVALCTAKAVLPLFPPEVQSVFHSTADPALCLERLAGKTPSFRLLPYEGVNGGGLVLVCAPEKAIFCSGKHRETGNWLVGVLPEGLSLRAGIEAILRLPDYDQMRG